MKTFRRIEERECFSQLGTFVQLVHQTNGVVEDEEQRKGLTDLQNNTVNE